MSDASLILSVSGLRGIVGESLTNQVAARYAAAFAQWLRRDRDVDTGLHVVVGSDSRPSRAELEPVIVDALAQEGCRVTRVGVQTTPAVALMVRGVGAEGGLMLTASHNPEQWNGIKPFTPDGAAPSPEQVAQIIDGYHATAMRLSGRSHTGAIDEDDTCGQAHVETILRNIDVGTIRARQFRVVLDSVHGAGGPSTALLLGELGATVKHLYAEPTGRFPRVPEPTGELVTELCEAVCDQRADIGLAQDSDADRLALVDEHGAYVGEEYTLALCSQHVLQCAPSGPHAVAANLSTSRMLDDVADHFGAIVLRTPVGEANVVKGMRQTGAIVGGEGNGGVIWPRIGWVRDSLAGIALVLDMMARDGRSLGEHVADIPRYAIVKDKVSIPEGDIGPAIARVREHFTSEKSDPQDGLRIDWTNRWVHIRPSNTEPIVRIIAEANDAGSAQALIDQVRAVIGAPATA